MSEDTKAPANPAPAEPVATDGQEPKPTDAVVHHTVGSQPVTAENTSTQITTTLYGSEYTQFLPTKRSWLRLFMIAMGTAVVGLVILAGLSLLLEGPEGMLSEIYPQKVESEAPPASATEIIAQEFSGKIEEIEKIDPSSLAEPLEPALPLLADAEPRDAEEEKEQKTDSKKSSPGRKIASIDKAPLKLEFDKGASKVSKNLEKGKVLGLLAKKIDDNCQPKLPSGTKSVKAEMKISKTGSISNIKVTPSAAESELAKCMRKKLGDAKALKPKDKKTASVTVHFKLK
jgi:hypothetical protein